MRKGLKPGERIKIFAALFAMLAAAMVLDCQLCYPDIITLYEGERLYIQTDSPYYLDKPVSTGGVLAEDGTIEHDAYSRFVKLDEVGGYETTIKLFGVIPVRTVSVRVEPKTSLAAGGNTVGIKIFTRGLVCVGTQSVYTKDGRAVDIAREQDIRTGDILLSANDTALTDTEQLSKILETKGEDPIHFVILRDETELVKELNPVLTEEGYKLGLWIRDSTAGIGTLTYYNESGDFGALGHPITDSDTGTIMPVSEGNLLKAAVIGIQKGKPGEPGELKGMFKSSESPLGVIAQNTQNGVFGTLDEIDTSKIIYPVASRNQVQEGKAEIISNIEGEKTETFEIEIQKVSRYHSNSLKDMVIRITDSRLLEATGGIVQGMSGSPILQNGRIVGAVTHV